MKYPFQKKSFWIILTVLFLIIFLFPPIYHYISLDRSTYEFNGWEFLFELGRYQGIASGILFFEMIIAFLLNYLGHLIFAKPVTNLGGTNKSKRGDQMKSLSVKLGIILIGLTILGYAEVWGEDWKYFGAGGKGTFWWYDTQGVTYHPNGVIQVWIKKVKADEIVGMVKSGEKITVSELERMTLERSYERTLIEINCAEKTLNQLQKFSYDSKGVLKSGESKLDSKKSIPTNSLAEKLYKAVCK